MIPRYKFAAVEQVICQFVYFQNLLNIVKVK